MLRKHFPGFLVWIPLSTAQVIFDGSWVNTDEQASCGQLTQTPGSNFVLKFSGTRITVRGPPPADPATIAATLDGTPSSLNPSGTGCMAFLYQTTALPAGAHVLNLTFVGPASNSHSLSINSWASGMDSDIAIISTAQSGTSTSTNPLSTSSSANPSTIMTSGNPSSAATTGSFGAASGAKPFGASAGTDSPSPSTGAPSGPSRGGNPSGTSTVADNSGISTSTHASGDLTVPMSSAATSTSSVAAASGAKTFGVSAGANSPSPSAGAASGTSKGANPFGADSSGISTGTSASGGSTAPNTAGASIGLGPPRPTGTNSSGTSPGAHSVTASAGGNHRESGVSTGGDHSGTSTGANGSRTSAGSKPPGPSTGANESSIITDAIPSSTAVSCVNRTGANICSTFTGANPSRTSTSRFCDLASTSGAYQSCGVKFGASAAPSVTSISANASGTSTGTTHHSAASTGGALGGAFGIVALLLAIIHQYFKAPKPSTSPDYYFWFVFPTPIKFRGKTLQDAQITVVLQPARLALTETQPERGFTLNGSRLHEVVAWKVFTLSAGKEGQHVRLPRNLGFGDVEDSGGSLATDSFFNFAPLRTLVTRTREGSWKSARFIIPGLTAMVVGKNAAPEPVDFALGMFGSRTYHAKRGQTEGTFHPFGVVRRVLNSQFCVVPQCEELFVNAYITQSTEPRQFLPHVDTNYPGSQEDPNAAPLPVIEDDDNEDSMLLLETNSSYPNRFIPGSQEDPIAAPRPIIEDDDNDDLSPKILSRGLLGANGAGQPVSSLKQRTRWDLVDDDQGVRLKMVTDARGNRKQWNDRWTYI
ncbi:hypothetical protein K438DRAFT_1980834 [Mycena galopus ATCC 62051]|nr:hypothetical protein K438DRAFT_1980834 [Mycena galopus ATCC 62051]